MIAYSGAPQSPRSIVLNLDMKYKDKGVPMMRGLINYVGFPKAGAFLWIALYGRILTSDRLKTIGILGPNPCVMCCADEEIANHLLCSCPVVEICWNWFLT